MTRPQEHEHKLAFFILVLALAITVILLVTDTATAQSDEEISLYFTGDITGGVDGSFTVVAPSGNPTEVEVWPTGSTPQEGERQYVGSFNFTLEGALMAEEEFQTGEFSIILANGQGSNNEDNNIRVEMDLQLNGGERLTGISTTQPVNTGDVEFSFSSESFGLDMAEGELITVHLYVIWDEGGTGDLTPPSNLLVKYDGGDHNKVGLDLVGQQVSFNSPGVTVDKTGKRVNVYVDVKDAFGIVPDLKGDDGIYSVKIMDDDEVFTADPSYIKEVSTPNGDGNTLEWEWEYGSNEAEPDNYTATLKVEDIREAKWNTKIDFEIEGENNGGGGGEVNYDVNIVAKTGTTRTISPKAANDESERAVFEFSVTNRGDETDTFEIEGSDVHSDWSYELDESFLTIAKGASKKVHLTVWPGSENIEDDEEVDITVTVESQGAKDNDKEAVDSDTVTTVIEVDRDFALEAYRVVNQYASFVSPAQFTLRLENIGNVDDSYSWSTANNGGWDVTMTRNSAVVTSIFLKNGEDALLAVEVIIQGEPDEGDSRVISLTMESVSDLGLTRSVSFTVEVRFDLDVDHDATNKKIKVEQKKEAKVTFTIASDSQESLEFRFEVDLKGGDIDDIEYHFKDEHGSEIDFSVEIDPAQEIEVYLYFEPSTALSPGDYKLDVDMLSKQGSKKLTSTSEIEFKVEEKAEDDDIASTLTSEPGIYALGGGFFLLIIVVFFAASSRKRKPLPPPVLQLEEIKDVEEVEDEEPKEEKDKEMEYSGKDLKTPTPGPVPTPAGPQAPAAGPYGGIQPAMPALAQEVSGIATVGGSAFPPLAGMPPRGAPPARRKRLPSGPRKQNATVGLDDDEDTAGSDEEEFIIRDSSEDASDTNEDEEYTVGGETEDDEFVVGGSTDMVATPSRTRKSSPGKKRRPVMEEEIELDEMELEVEEDEGEEDYDDSVDYDDEGSWDEEEEEPDEEEDEEDEGGGKRGGLFGSRKKGKSKGKDKKKSKKGKDKGKGKSDKGKDKKKSKKGKDKGKGKGKKKSKKGKKKSEPEEEYEDYEVPETEDYDVEEVYDEDVEIEY